MKHITQANRFYRTTMGLLLLAGLPVYVTAQEANLKVAQVSRDQSHHRNAAMPNESGGLDSQIQGLREELRQALERQDGRLKHIEEELQQLMDRNAIPQQPPAVSLPAPSATEPALPVPISKSKDKLTVCSQGCDYQDLQLAVDAAPPGGTVTLAPEINGSCAFINKPLHIQGLMSKDGQRAHLVGGVCNGKGALVTAAPDIVIDGLEISGIQISDGNGACVRMDPGTQNLEIRNIHCHDTQMGMLGTTSGRLLIEDSLIEKTVAGPSYSHAVYLTIGDEAIIRRSKIISARNAGHLLKSGFQKLTVEDSVIAALNDHDSRAIDAFGGGELVLRRNVIQQGPESDNSDVIGLALESNRLLPSGHSFLMEDNWVIFDNPGRSHKILLRGQELGPIVVRNNVFVGMNGLGIDSAKEEANQWFDSRETAGLPKFDGSLASLPVPGKNHPSGGSSGAKKRLGILGF